MKREAKEGFCSCDSNVEKEVQSVLSILLGGINKDRLIKLHGEVLQVT